MGTDVDRLLEREFLWATVAAIAFAGVAALLSVTFVGADRFWPLFSSSDGAIAVASILAAALVGWSSWFTLDQFGIDRPLRRGAIAGAITGTVAHPVMWFLWPLIPPTHGLAWTAVLMPIMAFWSFLFVGWITIPLAVAAGTAVGAIRIAVTGLTS